MSNTYFAVSEDVDIFYNFEHRTLYIELIEQGVHSKVLQIWARSLA